MQYQDRPLLFGLVALEQELVSPAELIDAFRAWRASPESSLGQILARQGKLSRDSLQAIERMLSDSPLAGQSNQPSPGGESPTTTWRPETTSHTLRNKSVPIHLAQPREALTVRFRPLRLHATGGLGEVFEAEDMELHRRVALKEIRPHYADDAASRRRFVLEAEVTGTLEHPGIVPVYGLGAHPNGRPFYAMRFIQGETLSHAIQKFFANKADFASLEFRQLLARLVDVCNAVAFAHSRGVVHRDLKPQNVMLGPFGETLVVDWGLAKPLAETESAEKPGAASPVPNAQAAGDDDLATATGELIGTPAFMSPEQAQGLVHEVGPASDVYSLGAMLYVQLTGELPRRGSALEMARAATQWQVPAVLEVQPRAPRPLAAVCAKAMARKANDRYASALDLAADIERWLADEPTSAYAEPRLDRAFRWVRKHRLPVAVVSAILLAASAALSVGYVLVSRERDVAHAERKRAVANAAATREVVEQFLIQIGDDRWSQIPGFEDVRLEMVNLAVDRYRGLVAQQPRDAELLADAAMTFRRCANLYRMVGQFAPARELYDDALRSLRQVAKADPRSDHHQQQLLEALLDRAILVRRVAGPTEAEPAFREALDMARALRIRKANSLGFRQDEARVKNDYADVLRQLGRYEEAMLLAQESATAFRDIADSSPKNVNANLTAAFSANTLGRTLRDAGQFTPAREALIESLARGRATIEISQAEPNVRFTLALTLLELAQLAQVQEGDRAQAEPLLNEAIAMLEQLTGEFPQTVSFRRVLADSLTRHGRWHFTAAEPERAAGSSQRALKLLETLANESRGAVEFEPLLAAACLLAGELESQHDNRAAARSQFLAARDHYVRARRVNPTNARLAEEERRCLELLAAAED